MKQPKSSVTFWITTEELEKFDDIALRMQTTRAALLRQCIIEKNRQEQGLL